MAARNDAGIAQGESQEEIIELTQAWDPSAGSPAESYRVELVAGHAPSLGTKTTSLLYTRLRAVLVLLTVLYAIVLVLQFVNESAVASGRLSVYRDVAIFQLLAFGALLALLYARRDLSQAALRAIEYSLFAGLVLLWIYARYRGIVLDVRAGDFTELLVHGREAMVLLFILMILHGMLVPHRWQETARVVFSMALSEFVVLALLRIFQPDVLEQFEEVASLRHVSTGVAIMIAGAILATYSSAVLNSLRTEVHNAKRYGQYQLVERLGGGGMGEVFLAEHALIKRPCALKLICAEAAGDDLAVLRFEREVQTTARLTHPNTIQIYDFGHTDDGTFYYVMEHLPGMGLDQLIAGHGPIPPGRAIYLLRQACSALAEAHDAGLIHRDLKPGNLFVSERGGLCDFVKVLDFGLVKLTKDPKAAQLTSDQTISGTPLYMAPEQAMGNRGLDGRSDLYALGAVAYHMLTGRPPFDGDNPVAILIEHASKEVVPPSQVVPEIPSDLEQVVLRCLAKRPDDRFPDAMALDEALANCESAGEWDVKQAALWWQERFAQPADAVGGACEL